jgi:uncharacterized protein (DUF58 family)
MRNLALPIALAFSVAALSAPAFSAPALARSATVRLTLKDGRFVPAQVTAPANQRLTIIVKNAERTAAEFESNTLRVEKVVTPGATIELHIRPLNPGRYRFFNDFHQETDGYLVVK